MNTKDMAEQIMAFCLQRTDCYEDKDGICPLREQNKQHGMCWSQKDSISDETYAKVISENYETLFPQKTSELTLNEYKELAMRTAKKQSGAETIRNACYGLCTEAGECMDVLKQHDFHGRPFDREHMIEEAGDVLWYLAQLADGLGVDLGEIAQKNVEKLKNKNERR